MTGIEPYVSLKRQGIGLFHGYDSRVRCSRLSTENFSAGITYKTGHIAVCTWNIPGIAIRNVHQDFDWFPDIDGSRKGFIAVADCIEDGIGSCEATGQSAEEADVFRSGERMLLKMVMKDQDTHTKRTEF